MYYFERMSITPLHVTNKYSRNSVGFGFLNHLVLWQKNLKIHISFPFFSFVNVSNAWLNFLFLSISLARSQSFLEIVICPSRDLLVCDLKKEIYSFVIWKKEIYSFVIWVASTFHLSPLFPTNTNFLFSVILIINSSFFLLNCLFSAMVGLLRYLIFFHQEAAGNRFLNVNRSCKRNQAKHLLST